MNEPRRLTIVMYNDKLDMNEPRQLNIVTHNDKLEVFKNSKICIDWKVVKNTTGYEFHKVGNSPQDKSMRSECTDPESKQEISVQFSETLDICNPSISGESKESPKEPEHLCPTITKIINKLRGFSSELGLVVVEELEEDLNYLRGIAEDLREWGKYYSDLNK